jgi:hypothetical protein
MKSCRTQFANLRATHFMRQVFTRESCLNRVDAQDPVVSILSQTSIVRDRLSKPTTPLSHFFRLDGSGPRLSNTSTSQKLGDWIARVGDKVQQHQSWNTT